MHPFMAIGDAIAGSDNAELDGSASPAVYPFFNRLGDLPQVEVARHQISPRIRNADEGAGQIVVRITHGLEQAAAEHPVGPGEDFCASHARTISFLRAWLWIARIMITWGVISALTLFIKTPFQFYAIRFLLGAAEAGFFPGIILYLTYWFPSHRRAKMTGAFMVGIPMAGIIGGPLSGSIMAFTHGLFGWHGWKWMFLLEAVPAFIVGVACMFYLDSRVRDAKWLSEQEKQIVERDIAAESQQKKEHPSLLAVFSDGRIWLMCWIYFTCSLGQYALTMWMPTLIKAAGISSVLNIGLVTAIPYICVAISMVALGASADRHRERRWHAGGPLIVGAITLVLSMMAGTHTTLAIVLLSIAAAGIIPASPMFWAIPTSFLAGTAATAGIATINSVANLGGFVAPAVVGYLKDVTHTNLIPMIVMAVIVCAGGLTAVSLPKSVNK